MKLAILAVILILGGCMDMSEMRRQCESKGGELVKINGAKTSHYECVKKIKLP